MQQRMNALAIELLDDLAPLEAAYGEGLEMLKYDPEVGGHYLALATAALLILIGDGCVQMGRRVAAG